MSRRSGTRKEEIYIKACTKLTDSDWKSLFNALDATSKKKLFIQLDRKIEILKKRKAAGKKAIGGNKPTKPKSKQKEEQKEDSKIDVNQRKISYIFGSRRFQCIKPSTGYPNKRMAKRAVEGKLKLFYAHGYSGGFDESRQNIYLSHDGKYLIYYIAAVIVVFDYESNVQRFFTKHNDDVTTICLSPKKTWCASGQRDPKDEPGKGKDLPKIYVWNYKTLKTVQLIDCVCWGKIGRLQWSPNSNNLYCICGDPDQTLKAWNANSFVGKKKELDPLIKCSTMREIILGFVINPKPSNAMVDEFLIFGKRKFAYCGIVQGKKDKINVKLKVVSVAALKRDGEKSYGCAQFLDDGRYLVGASSGSIYIGKKNQALLMVSAHDRAVGAMCLISKDKLLTAGFDRKFKTFSIDKDMGIIQTWEREIEIQDPLFIMQPRAIAYNEKTETLFCGCKTNQIIQAEMRHLKGFNASKYNHIDSIDNPYITLIIYGFMRRENKNFPVDIIHIVLIYYNDEDIKLIVDGHDGQIWGMCTSPNSDLFASAGYDNTIRIWDAKQMKCIQHHEMELNDYNQRGYQFCSAAWSNNGNILAFGTEDSNIVIFTYKNNKLGEKCIIQIPPLNDMAEIEGVAYLRFSKDSKLLGAAHMDSNLYIFSMNVDEEKDTIHCEMWQPMVHVAAPIHIQFSIDNKMIKCLTRDYEVAHWLLDYKQKKGKFKPSTPDPDTIKWADDPLIAGWDTQGLYQPYWDGLDLNDASITSDNKLIASGDDYGNIRLHNYPAIDSNASIAYKGHSEFVICVKFLRDDSQLISCGGNDMSIFQWKLIKTYL